MAIWKFASDENPDIVFAAAGDYLTKESLAAIDILKSFAPDVKIRFVNVTTISYSGFGAGNNVLSKEDYYNYFTKEKPVIFNFHGYPQTVKQILFDYAENPKRYEVRGYIEEGSTTSPFDMQVRNKTDRLSLVKQAADFLLETNVIDNILAEKINSECDKKLVEHKEYIIKNGVDLPEIEDWKWSR